MGPGAGVADGETAFGVGALGIAEVVEPVDVIEREVVAPDCGITPLVVGAVVGAEAFSPGVLSGAVFPLGVAEDELGC
jgi:hypothetical protein